jgi:hypothetical protein
VFGLGLQSAFMWTEEIRVSTRRYSADEGLEIVFHNPNNKKQGLIEIEKSPLVPAIGSKLSIKVLIEREENVFLEEEGLAVRYWAQHDPLLDGGFYGDVYQVLEKSLMSTDHAPIPVDISFDGETLPTRGEEYQGNDPCHSVFLKSENAYFGVNLHDSSELWKGENVVRYRGQPVEKLKTKDGLEFLGGKRFFSYTLDIWAGKADEWLTFDRSRLTALGVRKIEEMIERNLKQWVEINRSSLSQNNDHAIALSFLASLRQSGPYDEDGFWTEIAKEQPEKWLESTCSSSLDGLKTLGGILEKSGNRRFVLIDGNFGEEDLFGDPDLWSKSIFNLPSVEAKMTLDHWLNTQPDNGLRMHAVEKLGENNKKFLFLFELVRRADDSLSKIEVSTEVQAALIDYYAFKWSLRGENRLLFPCFLLPEEIDLSKISLNEETRVKGAISPFEVLPKGTQLCVLPFELPKRGHFLSTNDRISLDRLSEFIDWVMENLADKTAKRSEVEAEYDKIIIYFNNDLMANNQRWQSAIKKPIQLTEKTESSENE